MEFVEDPFTNEEKERITQLYGNDFADIEPDDALLIGRWEAYKATTETQYQAQIEAIKEETQAHIEQIQINYEQSRANLQELHDLAVARFEAMSNG